MQKNRRVNPFEAKRIARRKYAERQIQKFIDWSWSANGRVQYKEIKRLHKEYAIQCLTFTKY